MEEKELKQRIAELEAKTSELKKTKEGKEAKQRTVVVKELTQEVRQAQDTDGTILNFITTEEALTEIMNQE